jgi:hypothetical protein
LIYQHFRREKRRTFAARRAAELRERIGAELIEAFRTPQVLFLLAAQARHADAFAVARTLSSRAWKGHVDVMGLSAAQDE